MTRCLFVDGSCIFPSCPRLALASWAVVSIAPRQVLLGGPLHGVLQTNDRAEIVALHGAALWALYSQECVMAFSDSKYALDGFTFLRNHDYIPRHWKNDDLWAEVQVTLAQLDSSMFSWHKVDAHRHLEDSDCPSLDFLWAGNHFADATAKRYNVLRPEPFLHTYENFAKHDRQAKHRVQTQLSFLLALAQKDLQNTQTTTFDPEDLTLDTLADECALNDSNLGAQLFDFERTCGFSGHFPLLFVQTLGQWVAGIDITAVHKRPVTTLELLVGFQVTTGLSLPIPVEKDGRRVYVFPEDVACGGLVRPTVSSCVAMFQNALETLFEEQAMAVTWSTAQRPAAGLFRSLRALVVGWPSDLSVRVDTFLISWVNHRPIRRSCDLARPIW